MSCSLDRRFASLLVFSDSGDAFDYFSVPPPVAIGAAIKQANWFEMQEITFLLEYVRFVEPNKCKQMRVSVCFVFIGELVGATLVFCHVSQPQQMKSAAHACTPTYTRARSSTHARAPSASIPYYPRRPAAHA